MQPTEIHAPAPFLPRIALPGRALGLLAAAVLALGGCDSDDEDSESGSSQGSSASMGSAGEMSSGDDSDSGAMNGLQECAGDYSGTFDGDDMGLAEATVEADGSATLTFTTTAGPVNAMGQVTPDGQVSGSEDATTVTGTLNFDDCTMSGTWVTTGFGDGTWQAALE